MNATRTLLLAATLLGAAICAIPTHAQTLPALPQSFVDTSYPVMTGTTINVPAGGSFQTALDQAQLGDTITLAAGATYSGTFTLSPKSGSGWIIIRTSAPDSSLPAQGHRITPSYSPVLPKIVTTSSAPAIQTVAGAHHYRLVGLEINVASGVSINYGIVTLGDGGTQTSLSQVPHDFVLDRVYIHGQSDSNVSRGVALNSATSAVIDSYVSECHLAGFDAQAICGWNGPGPFKIVNNYLSGAGENVLFGGGDPSITNLVPSDIEVRGNYFFKPTAWQSSTWTVKNILELKNAQRVLIDGNIFEHNWPQAQNGYSILFTVRNQDGSAPWSIVQDVTFTHNIVRHVSSGVYALGIDDIHTAQQEKRILIKDNVFDDVSGVNWGGFGRLFQVLNSTANVTIDHNTAFQSGEVVVASGTPNPGFTYRNNLSPNNQYGVAGDNFYGNSLGALNFYYPGYVFVKNILQGGDPAQYPPNNFFPATMNDVGFVNLAGGDYHLAASSAYKNAGTDGKDIGADINGVNSATAGAVSGDSSAPPPPPPPADTTPPTVSITAPANGATVSGTTTVTANASDNVGVAGVQFYLGGVALGAEVTASPFAVSWNTNSTSNGAHTLTAKARDAAGNNTTSAPVNVAVSNAPATRAPFHGTPFQIPGRFEAEDFDLGGEGVAYHDLTPGNQGGYYRLTEDVDIISPYVGGYVVNSFQTGEWMEYTINVTASGTYRIEALVSSMYTTSAFHVEIDGTNKTGSVAVPNTGWWGTFQWIGNGGISLSAGQHVLRLSSDVEYFNVDALRITQDLVADTTPPTVAITAPSNGATVSGTTTVTANASDNVGVAGVQFYLDGVALGAEVTASPFAVSWNTNSTSNGAHTLTAKARDAAGNNTTSAGVTVTVANTLTDTTPPTVSITAPSSGATVSGTMTVTANASDNVGVVGVQFYVDGSALGAEDTVAPYAVSWDTTRVANGGHTLTGRARDAAGNTATSAAVNVTVSNAPGTQTPFTGTPFAVPGRFEAEDFDKGGEGVAYHDLTPGNQGGYYRLTEDVDIINPYPGGYVVNNFQTGEWLEYTINVSQSGTYLIEALVSSMYTTSVFHVEIDGTNKTGSVAVPNTGWWGTFQWVGKDGISLSAGQHVLRMTADVEYFNFDAMRISASTPPPDTTPPTVAITAPSNGATVSGTTTVTANASDNVGVAGVQFYLDGVALGAEVTASPFAVSWNTNSTLNGAHTLTAKARDAAGNNTTSAGVTVTVANTLTDTTPPTVSITAPSSGATVSGTMTVTANASDNVGVVGVQFYLDGSTLGAEVMASPFAVSWNTTTASNGAHTLTAKARDAAGNSSTCTPVSAMVSNSSSSPKESPYKGTPSQVPGRFEAEDFDLGGEGVAYHDLTPGNQGGYYRLNEDVDIISPYPFGYVVNNFQTGEWLNYTINVSQSGTYRIEALVSSEFTTSRFHVEIDGTNKTGSINVPSTGSWGTFQWVGMSGITLPAGQHVLKIYADAQYFNIDAISTSLETALTTVKRRPSH